MQISPDTMRILMEMDAPAEQKIALMKAMESDWMAYAPPATSNGINEERERLRNESTYAERKRAKDRERQRQLREAAKQSRDVAGDPRGDRSTSTATEGDTNRDTGEAAPSRTGAQVVIPSLPSLRSEELGVGGGVTPERVQPTDDWPAGKASDHAELLIRTVESPWLDQNKSPDLVTTRGRIAAWKRDGASWEHDVLPVVTGLCANRRSRISSWKFFDAAISRSIGENRAALEIPEASSVIPFRNTGPPRTIDEKSSASWDYAIARIAADEQS